MLEGITMGRGIGRMPRGRSGYIGSDHIVNSSTGRSTRIDRYSYVPADRAISDHVSKSFCEMAKANPEVLGQAPDIIEQRLMERIYNTDERGLIELYGTDGFEDNAYAAHSLVMSMTGGLPNPEPEGRVIYASGGKASGKKKLLAVGVAGAILAGAAGVYLSRPPADDTPNINSTSVDEHPEVGKANIVTKIADLDGVKEVVIEINGVNSTMTNAPGGFLSKSDTYFSNVTMGADPVNLPFKIYVTDTRGHSAVSSGNIDWSRADAAITSAYLNNRNTTIARKVTEYMPGILDYPLSFLPTVDAINSVAYDEVWNPLFLKNGEDYLWEKGLAPAVNYVIGLENSGKIDVLDKVLSTNSTLDNLLRQKVILPNELSIVDMISGDRHAGLYNRIEMLVYNTNPNPNLNNTSPQEYMGNLFRELYSERGEGYDYSLCAAGVGHCWGNLPDNWPNSYANYKIFVNELATSDNDIPFFIKGIPVYLRVSDKLPLGSGQGSPYYSVLVGREFGIPTVVYGAIYPTWSGSHDEPGVWLNDKDSFLVLWRDIDAFIKDYEGQVSSPILGRGWNNKAELLVK